MPILRIELCGIGVSGLTHCGNTHNPGFLAAGVIEESLITHSHLIAHEIARLIITNAVPCNRPIRQC